VNLTERSLKPFCCFGQCDSAPGREGSLKKNVQKQHKHQKKQPKTPKERQVHQSHLRSSRISGGGQHEMGGRWEQKKVKEGEKRGKKRISLRIKAHSWRVKGGPEAVTFVCTGRINVTPCLGNPGNRGGQNIAVQEARLGLCISSKKTPLDGGH